MIEIIPNWHPIWVHFPIALLSLSVVLFWVARFWPSEVAGKLTTVARFNLGAGVVMLIPSLVTGYLAYDSVPHDAAGHEAMTRHLYAAWITTGVFAVAALLAWLERHRWCGAGVPLLVVLLAGLIAISVTGYLGGENVYRHGIGVERLPDTDGHDHNGHDHHSDDHDHDHDHDHDDHDQEGQEGDSASDNGEETGEEHSHDH